MGNYIHVYIPEYIIKAYNSGLENQLIVPKNPLILKILGFKERNRSTVPRIFGLWKLVKQNQAEYSRPGYTSIHRIYYGVKTK